MVAPIALYPDSLLTQILMASTYPLEIVEAERFMRENPDLKGDALDQALLDKDWDPSVKSLCTLPDVLKQMSDNLDWTQDLGDAFLAQESELMDTVQRMRGKAYEAGNLETTEQQTVTQQPDNIIIIESPSPEIIYVPTYSPTVVYGPAWGYPSWYYPPFYYPPRPGYGLISFGIGVAVGGALWGGVGWGWGRTNIDIDINRYNTFNRNTNRNFERTNIDVGRGQNGRAEWKHDASHRKGVNYRSAETARQHGATSGSNRVTRDQARGRNTSAGVSNRAGSMQARDRSASNPSSSSGNANRAASSNRSRTGGNTAFSGSRSPSVDRRASNRGAASRGTRSFSGSGMARSGGRRR